MTKKIDINKCNGISTLNGVDTYQYTDKDAANDLSESLKSEWPQGFGLVYGPFLGESGSPKDLIYEVTVPPRMI